MSEERRGGAFVLTLDLLDMILGEQLGFAGRRFEIRDITTAHYMRAAKISFLTDNIAFPIVEPGKEIPCFMPLVRIGANGKPEIIELQPYT